MPSIIGFLIGIAVIGFCSRLKLDHLAVAVLVLFMTVSFYTWHVLSNCVGDCGIRIDVLGAFLLVGLMGFILLCRLALFHLGKGKKAIPAAPLEKAPPPSEEVLQIFDAYTAMVRDFVTEKTTGKEFAAAFSRQYGREEAELSEDMYDILDWLTEETNAFTDDPSLKRAKPDRYIHEAALRQVAGDALKEMDALRAGQ